MSSDKLLGIEYCQGYTAACLDIAGIMEYISEDMKRQGMRWNRDTVLSLLKVITESRADLRADPDLFIRCNREAAGGFEIFNQKTRTVWKRSN